ncbi:MAG TPA: metallopeptidase family protein [Solirubrobacteraceae bacterium]|nr:metallopeptidase family protein [Solirubrobacteraceae bacterium]
MRPPTPRRILAAAAVALCVGLGTISILGGFSSSFPLQLLQGVAVLVGGAVVIGGPLLWLGLRLANWRDPASEEEFETLVRRSEQLAHDNLAVEPDEGEFLELDPHAPADFEQLVAEALDGLPAELKRALDHNVAVMISDGGSRRGAYGLYHGDGLARDNVPDRIVIYRDTLLRDFGDDPDALRAQVLRTVRHELAHHVGFDELGVSRLDL